MSLVLRKNSSTFTCMSLPFRFEAARPIAVASFRKKPVLCVIPLKTGFFRKLATAIGLAASKRKGSDMQVKVEEFFRKTRLMLVIDEAHYLFPRLQQRESSPALVDWVNTALVITTYRSLSSAPINLPS